MGLAQVRSTTVWWGPLIGVLAGLATSCAQPCENPTQNTLGQPTSWEQAYLSGPDTPVPAAQFLVAEDGLPLAYHEWVPEDWDGSGAFVVFIHGSSAYGELYAPIGEGLAARGVLARLVDLRGHGRSVCDPSGSCGSPVAEPPDDSMYFVGRKGDSLDANQIIRDISRHIADLREQWPDARVGLAGHSSGAGVVSRYVEHNSMSNLDAVALVAPVNNYEQPQMRDDDDLLCPGTVGTTYAQVDLGALGDALRGNEHRYVIDFRKDPQFTAELDTLRYSWATLQGMNTTDPDDFWGAYTAPHLYVAGAQDTLFDMARSMAEHERAPGGGSFVIVDETSHIGLAWSDGVAGVLAAWAKGDPVPSGTVDP